MKKVIALLLAGWLIGPALADDESGGYVGLQFGESEADDGFIEVETDYRLLRIGYAPNKTYAFEYRIGRGSSDDIQNGVRFELENVYGLFGLYHFNFAEKASVYGVLGLSQASFKISNAVTSTQVDDNILSYGAGVQFYGVNVEYMKYLDTSDIEMDTIAVGYNYHF